MKKTGISLLIIGIVLAIGLTFNLLFKNLNYGLDLQGGFEVLYQVEPIGEELTTDMVSNTYKTLLKRIDVLGVSEPSITIEGDNRIRVGLAGIEDPDEARVILGKQAVLTFRDTADTLLMTSEVLKSGGAKVTTDESLNPAVSLAIKDKDTFYQVTKAISESEDKTIVIWLDYEEGDSFSVEGKVCGNDSSNCLSAATVSQGFSGDVIISGPKGENKFTQEKVENLVNLINSGSMPTNLKEISSRTITAEFGSDTLNKSLFAGIIGIVLIMAAMTLIYRFAGLISCLGILVYTYLAFLLFYLIGGVLTLPGIAALVIGIGMSIDAAVINFARIKDELKEGKSLQTAFKNGNKNSFLTIMDANITTFIVALVLFIFGESSVKGFATMLMLSIFVTFIIMVYFIRYLLKFFVQTGFFDNKEKLFVGYVKEKKERFKKLEFVKLGKKYIIFIGFFILIGIGSLIFKGLNLGLDFRGGTSVNIKASNITQEEIINDIKGLNYELVDIDKISETNYILTISDVIDGEKVNEVNTYFYDKYSAYTEIGVISNVVKKDLIFNAIKALIFASIGIIIYISMRFKFNYAVGGIIALVHDVLLVVVIFSLFNLEVSGLFIAAILSIIGYSINDSIVTFDRIREKRNELGLQFKEEDLKDVVNVSIKKTLNRSIITTLTTLFPVIALIIFGSYEILNFNIALFIGLIFGTMSSILIASQIWYYMEKKNIGKINKKKWYEE